MAIDASHRPDEETILLSICYDLTSMDSSTVSSALAATIGIAEKSFEICAVDEQAKSLLKTADQVAGQLRYAKALRHQKSHLFTVLEKQMFDETLISTDDAIREVATLAERTRADLNVSGKIRLATRIQFIFRDSPRIQVTLTQLIIANQNLSRDLTTMCNRESLRYPVDQRENHLTVLPTPPSYEETMFIAEQRQKNARRRNSAHPLYEHGAASSMVSLPARLPSDFVEAVELPAEVRPYEMSSLISPVRTNSAPNRPCLFESFSQTNVPSLSFEGATIPQRHQSGRHRSMLWLETNSR